MNKTTQLIITLALTLILTSCQAGSKNNHNNETSSQQKNTPVTDTSTLITGKPYTVEYELLSTTEDEAPPLIAGNATFTIESVQQRDEIAGQLPRETHTYYIINLTVQGDANATTNPKVKDGDTFAYFDYYLHNGSVGHIRSTVAQDTIAKELKRTPINGISLTSDKPQKTFLLFEVPTNFSIRQLMLAWRHQGTDFDEQALPLL